MEHPAEVNPKVNWKKSVEGGLIPRYTQSVSDTLSPLLSRRFQSVSELSDEIVSVSKVLTQAAAKHLSSTRHHRKTKPLLRTQSSGLYANRVGGRGNAGGQPAVLVKGLDLYEEKRDTKKRVRQYVAMCRAREERARIQARDTLFRENNRTHFRSSNPRTACKGLRINDSMCTNPQEIANHFRDHFKDLATSSPSIPYLETSSFLNCENILDSEVDLEEIEGAVRALKLGKSGGSDSLDPEHMYYGGDTLKFWLKKVFNRILTLEQIPAALNEGLIIPIHKGKGKDPLNQGITE